MANQMCAVGIYGTINENSTTYKSVGLGTSYIRSIEPYIAPASGQPSIYTNAGITILTVIKMAQSGTKVGSTNYLSNVATATVITAAT